MRKVDKTQERIRHDFKFSRESKNFWSRNLGRQSSRTRDENACIRE